MPYSAIADGRDPAPAASARRCRSGIAETDLRPARVDFAAEPHLLVFGDAESGKSTLLRGLATTISERFAPEEARIVLVDYRRSLLGAVDTDHLIGYGTSAEQTAELIASVAAYMQRRLPGPDVTAGAAAHPLVVDRAGVLRAGRRLRPGRHRPGQPAACRCWTTSPQARDIGLHLVVARRSGGALRATVRAGAAAAAGAVLARPAHVRRP